MIVRRIRSFFAFAPPLRAGAALRSDSRDFEGDALRPEEPLCLIGDLHGRADLLQVLLEERARRFADHRLVVLGDMIDRGEDSAKTLSVLRDETRNGAVCLMGNHEALLLDALDALERPDQNSGASVWRWLQNGGLSTMCSYGLRQLPREPQAALALLPELIAQIGQDMILWLRNLPLQWRSGNLIACHAGMDPARTPAEQSPETLLWGHPDFFRIPRRDGVHIAHGHVIAAAVRHAEGRLSLDTGAYATGRLGFALADPRLSGAARLRAGLADRSGCHI